MKKLSIYTRTYKQELKTFFAENTGVTDETGASGISACGEGLHGELFFIDCEYDCFPAAAFVTLLEHAAIQENPVYKNSARLKAMALELQNTDIHTANINDLTQYIRENRELHMEGYISFRMPDYQYKLDMMMYSLIKKLGLTKK